MRKATINGDVDMTAEEIAEFNKLITDGNESTINSKIAMLWNAADAYVAATINGVALSMLALGVSQGKPKAIAVAKWCDSVWAYYYVKKAKITADSAPDYDFSSLGDKPHTVDELREEVYSTWAE